VDSFGTDAGGIEVWVEPEARPGIYVVDYVVERPPGRDVEAKGTIIDRLGTHPVEPKLFRRDTRELRVHAARLQIDGDGKLTLR
jgi:hypothetical protein